MRRIALVAVVFVVAACDAERSKWTSYWSDRPGQVTQYSGGRVVGDWCSSGKIMDEDSSDGYYFRDAATDKLVEVSGDVRIIYESNGCSGVATPPAGSDKE